MLTHVTDHLTSEAIPVVYLDPEAETQAEKYDHMRALVAAVVSAQAEYVAIGEGLIDAIHEIEEGDNEFGVVDLEATTLDRLIIAREALDRLLADWIGYGALKSAA